MGAKSRGNFAFNPNPEMCCPGCIWPNEPHSDWCGNVVHLANGATIARGSAAEEDKIHGSDPDRHPGAAFVADAGPLTPEHGRLMVKVFEEIRQASRRGERIMYLVAPDVKVAPPDAREPLERGKSTLEGCGTDNCDMCDEVDFCPKWLKGALGK